MTIGLVGLTSLAGNAAESVPAADIALYRAAVSGLPPLPEGMEGIVFKLNRPTRDDADMAGLVDDQWTCSDGSSARDASARLFALPAGRPEEILPPEVAPPGFRVAGERPLSQRLGDIGGYHGNPRYEVGEIMVGSARKSPDGRRAAVFFILVIPEYGLVELERPAGEWKAVRYCESPRGKLAAPGPRR